MADCGTVAGYTGRCRCDSCRAAWAQYQRDWKKQNRDKVNAGRRDWSARHPDYDVEKSRRYRDANPVLLAERRKVARWSSEYHSRKRAVKTLPYTREQLAAKVAYWGSQCWMCGGPWTDIDHVKPVSVGGPHMLANLRPACRRCNSSKKNKWPYQKEAA